MVYREGRAYRVDRALLKESGAGADGMLVTFSTTICPLCGAARNGESPETCHVRHSPLGSADITRDLDKIGNVGTRAIERITANDEERQRQGFDIQTTFAFDHIPDRHKRELRDGYGEIFSAEFAPAALVRRINRRLRRRRDQQSAGFMIDPRSG